ncbi:hypothetical protein [Leptospira idonii]|uniref:Tetratricopeptide repeat protein n=1 Tax=Leptospira idonii TaxID=1193500 RepID=A0A4R9M241_9LEPT|nr:hypothetical protein [Leptospira idonii]TGN19359.1 hypothetical protein EHS15_08420 [Leptospira idonii]
MDSQWKRFWETGLFPSLEFSLSLSFGYFLSLLFYISSRELSLVDTSDSALPILQGILTAGFGFGFVYRKYSQNLPKPLTIVLCVLILTEWVWVFRESASEFLIDYIFSFDLILVGGAVGSFVAGLYSGSLRDYRFLSFALGITLFTFHSLFDPNHGYSLKTILLILFTLLEIYLLSTFLQKSPFSLRFYKIRSKIGRHPLFAPFYRSALSLLLAYCFLHLYFQPGPKIPLILSISFSVFFGRILSLVTSIKRETKAVFLIARILLVVAFFFFIYQSYWNSFYIALCILLGGIIGFFKPNETKQKEYIFVSLEAAGYIGLSLLLYHWNIMLGIRSLLALLFVPILTLPYLRQKNITRLPKVLMFCITSLLAVIFFYPPSIRTSLPFSKNEIYDPIPFQILNLDMKTDHFIFYRSILPFPSNNFLPKKSEIEDKIVILSLKNNQSQIISYIERLSEETHPFLIFVSRNKNNPTHHINALSLLQRLSFWSFDVYYPSYMKLPVDFSSDLPKDWRIKYFHERLENASPEEAQNVLDSIIRFSGGDLRKDALTIKHSYYESYSSYASYYHELGQNKLALDAIALARKFETPKKDLLRIAYNSLKYATPEPDFIPILEDLSLEPEFQEFAWNTLVPMFESLGDWNNALKNMSNLERYYRAKNQIELANELELVKVRLYLNQENWKEAEPLILTRFKENPQSVIWERLKNELIEKKDSSRRVYVRPEMKEARIQ